MSQQGETITGEVEKARLYSHSPDLIRASLLSLADDPSQCYGTSYDGTSENVRVQLQGDSPTASERMEVYQRVRKFGFAIVSVGEERSAEEVVRMCAGFGLEEIFVPDYLKHARGMIEACGMNFIPPYPHPDLPPVNTHKAFLGTTDHALHVDGANCPGVGMVKSAALYCVTKAAEGGESTVFNAVAALVALCEEDIELVLPLFHPQALTRNGSAELSAVTAPAFVLGDGELRTRYSVDYTSTWNVDCVAGLRESFDRLEALSCVGSSFYSETMLEAGELFIMANGRIAHGRRGFRNSETITRRLGRALFLDTVKA